MDVIYGFHCRFHYRFHCGFHFGFHCKFHVKSTRFHYSFHGNFITSTRISPKINKISWNPQLFTGFHLNQQDFIMDFTLDSIPVADPQISYLKSGRFHESTRFHAWNPLNQIIQEKLFTFIECREPMSYEICDMSQFHMKSTNSTGFY